MNGPLGTAHRLPGPPELLPYGADAVVDLRTAAGADLVGAVWRHADARVVDTDFVGVGEDLGPSGPPNRTATISPSVTDDDSSWRILRPEDLELRLGTGRVSFGWYRTTVTVPARLGDLDPTGATIVFEIVVDDHAEVWVDGELPKALGDVGGPVVAGFNAPNRVVLTRDARPGDTFAIAVLGINGPLSADPQNYIWVRSCSLDVYAAGRAAVGEPVPDAAAPPGIAVERVATGFRGTAAPLWHDGALLFSSPPAHAVYRWSTHGVVSVFRPKSGAVVAMVADDQGRLLLQRADGSLLRVNPHGDTTELRGHVDPPAKPAVLDVVELPEASTGAAWDDQGRDLYVTAHTSVYRLRFEEDTT
jgi:gluconolactonase